MGDFIIKLKKFGIISIIILFIIGVIYSLITYLINIFKKPEPITFDIISEYMTEENVVTDYTTFFTLEDILQQILQEFIAVNDSNNADASNENVDVQGIYNILDEEYQKLYSKKEVIEKINTLIEENYKPKSDDDYFEIIDMLDKAYKFDEYYILQFLNIDGEPMYLLVKLLSSDLEYRFNFVIM